MVFEALHKFSDEIVGWAGKVTENALIFAREVSNGSLKATEWTLDGMGSMFFFIESWQKGLRQAAQQVRYSADVSNQSLDMSIETVEKAFSTASESLFQSKLFAQNFVYDNRFFSSIIGSSHDNKISMTKITLSLREKGKDISVSEALKKYTVSKQKKAVLLIPGLFCDETLWMDCQKKDENEKEYTSIGLTSKFASLGYYSFFLRYNQGMHISDSGQALLDLLDEFFQNYTGDKLDIVSYSQGGLVLRSLLYQAKKEHRVWLDKIGKVILISCPDGGSYLEKIGFWAGVLMENSPTIFLKLTGIIGNLRSDGIKDLSHGIIREEDWRNPFHLGRYVSQTYFGELDGIDAYQFYSLIGEGNDPLQEWFGDGIVEKSSLIHLTKKVFQQKPNPENRSHLIRNSNHFLIMESEEFFTKLLDLFD